MAGKFNLNEILNQGKPKEKKADVVGTYQIKNIDIENLVPSEENFYSMNDIEELKNNIELTGKVLQALIVTDIEGKDGLYKILSGHRRRQAILSLISEGKTQYKKVPCVIEDTGENAEDRRIKEELLLIAANSQREKTAWDKIEETKRTRALLEDMKKQGDLSGGVRQNIANVLRTSATQVARYDAINRNLIPELIELLKYDKINISVAYELSGLDKVNQELFYQSYINNGSIELLKVQEIKRRLKETQTPEEKTETTDKEKDPPKHKEETQTGAVELIDDTALTPKKDLTNWLTNNWECVKSEIEETMLREYKRLKGLEKNVFNEVDISTISEEVSIRVKQGILNVLDTYVQ